MYNIIANLIGYTGSTGSNYYSYIIYGCISIIILFTAVVIDMIYRTIRHFWR